MKLNGAEDLFDVFSRVRCAVEEVGDFMNGRWRN